MAEAGRLRPGREPVFLQIQELQTCEIALSQFYLSVALVAHQMQLLQFPKHGRQTQQLLPIEAHFD